MVDFYRRNKQKLMAATAVVMAFAVAFASTKAFGVIYQTNDDATLANIAAGAYGSDTLRMVYVNVLFSLILRPLYAMHTANWYVLVQLLLVTISIATVSYILMKRMGFFCGGVISAAMLVAFADPIFHSFQYTESAFIILSCGLIVLIDNLGEFNWKTIAGILLALMGSLIRWDVFYAVGGLSSVLFIYQFFRLEKVGKNRAVITMAVLFAVIFGAKAVDVMAYKTDPRWNEFYMYNKARTAYSDYKVYQLSDEENPFEEYGITDIDYTMLNNWNFYDEEKFTTQLLNEISQGGQQITVKELALQTFEQIKEMLCGNSYRIFFMRIILLSVISLRPRWSSVAMVFMYGIFSILVGYLVYRMRFVFWVEMGIIWTVSVFALYCIGQTQIKSPINMIAAVAILGVMVYLCVPAYKQLYLVDRAVYAEWAELEEPYFEAMVEDKEHIYLLSTLSIENVAGHDVQNPRQEGFFSNIVAYGGWLSRAPHRDKVLADYGLERPLVDAVDNPLVYLDYHNINEAAEYAESQLGKEVYTVATGDNPYAPYQLVTDKTE